MESVRHHAEHAGEAAEHDTEQPAEIAALVALDRIQPAIDPIEFLLNQLEPVVDALELTLDSLELPVNALKPHLGRARYFLQDRNPRQDLVVRHASLPRLNRTAS